MAKILCLETASTNCSVSVGIDGEVISLVEQNSLNYSHAEQLHVFIKRAVDDASLSLTDLDAIAVSKGPGSYTGLRIGVSAAKGLCFSLEIPLISVPTLKSMATQILPKPDEILISLLDARRMEVYSQAFDHNYNSVSETKAEIVTEDSFHQYKSSHKIHLLGSGAQKCMEVIKDEAFEFHPDIIPSAKQMVVLAHQKHGLGELEDVAYFEPYYLKDFIIQGKKKL